jgi:hypothetical protein
MDGDMNLTSKQAAAYRRIIEGPATPFDIGVAVGADQRQAVQVTKFSKGDTEAKRAMGAIGHRIAQRLVEGGLVVAMRRKGVIVYTPTPTARLHGPLGGEGA